MTKSKLPKILAIVGIAIGFASMAAQWYILTYNPFHLPSANATLSRNYTEPMIASLVDDVIFGSTPGTFLIFGFEGTAAWFAWGLAALLNGFIYYWIGRGIVALTRRREGSADGPSAGGRATSRLPWWLAAVGALAACGESLDTDLKKVCARRGVSE